MQKIYKKRPKIKPEIFKLDPGKSRMSTKLFVIRKRYHSA